MTPCERTVKFGVFTLTLFYVGLHSSVTGFSVGFKENEKINDIKVSRLLRNLNQSVDPCNDFYSFVCGDYVADAKPKDRVSEMTIDSAGPDVRAYAIFIKTITKILLSEINIPGDISTAKNIFNSCKQISKIPVNTTTLVREIIDEMKIGWLSKTIRNETFDEPFDLVETAHKLRKIGLNFQSLLGLYVNPRSNKDKRNILEIRRPLFSQDLTTADKEGSVFVEAEQLEIVKAGEYFDSLNNSFPLEKFVKGLLTEGSSFSRDDEIRVDKRYITKLVEFLRTTPKEDLAKLFTDKIVNELGETLLFTNAINDINVLGSPMYISLCATTAILWDLNAEIAVSNYLVSGETANYVNKIVDSLLRTFVKLVKNSERITRNSKETVIKSLNELQILIVHTNTTIKNPILDWTNVDHKQFVKNLLKLSKAQADAKFLHLNTSVDVRDWNKEQSPFTYNGAYDVVNDRIYMPALYIYSILYELNLPNSMNYGSIGYTIAHEMTHALYAYLSRNFANLFRIIDMEICMGKEYIRTLEKETPVNHTKKSYEEDIADLVGFKVAYQSYIESEKNYGEDDVLPSTTYTSRQLFWISGANYHCSKIYKTATSYAEHSPSNVRVLMSYANLPEFARDFNCPVGSAMISKHKCNSFF